MSAPMKGAAQLRYPDVYPWIIFAAAMDVMMTHTVLFVGGSEVNAIAARVIEIGGLWGMALLKLAVTVLVLAICEFVGRRRFDTGLRLAQWAMAINCVPVMAAFLQLIVFWDDWTHNVLP